MSPAECSTRAKSFRPTNVNGHVSRSSGWEQHDEQATTHRRKPREGDAGERRYPRTHHQRAPLRYTMCQWHNAPQT
jgi:hypothetical protein